MNLCKPLEQWKSDRSWRACAKTQSVGPNMGQWWRLNQNITPTLMKWPIGHWSLQKWLMESWRHLEWPKTDRNSQRKAVDRSLIPSHFCHNLPLWDFIQNYPKFNPNPNEMSQKVISHCGNDQWLCTFPWNDKNLAETADLVQKPKMRVQMRVQLENS